jgi:soluble lytic murein transglycosylase
MYHRVLLAIFLSSFVAADAPRLAQTVDAKPQPMTENKPILPLVERHLTPSDASLVSQAFAAISAKDWRRGRVLAQTTSEPMARDLIAWRLLTDRGSDATFEELDRFLRERPSWPTRLRLRLRAEEAILEAPLGNDAVVAWFGKEPPRSPSGMIRLGEALLATGNRDKGISWIRSGWVAGDFSSAKAAELHRRHRALLREADHVARTDRLVWKGLDEPLAFMRKVLNTRVMSVVDARRKLQRVTRDSQRDYDKLPAESKQDPGLLFDRARWLRKRSQDEAARPLLLMATKNLRAEPPNVDAWWKELQYQVREALDVSEQDQAYQLASNHRMSPSAGEPFAAAEFLAGWIALRFLDKPEAAGRHFSKLAATVGAPVSRARAHYWLGRAAEAQRKEREAQTHYQQAAAFPLTYYGQLAAAKRGVKSAPVTPDAPIAESARREFESRDEVRALRILMTLNETASVREFALGLADRFSKRDEFVLLAEALQSVDLPGTTVRVARRGIQKNLVAMTAAYPRIELPQVVNARVAPELTLGLVRQESEFNPLAVSVAGARGLMQLMPATARSTAKAHGLQFRNEGELFSPHTNLLIGQAHLADLLHEFDGSYVLAIGSYNAGAHRVRKWIERYGDPRDPRVDTVDWIERVPFNETRGYIQRVLENVQAYREVLGADTGSLVADLERGSFARATPSGDRQLPVPASSGG